MSLAVPASPPPTKLGLYRLLSPQAGVRVSPFALGGLSIGDKWADAGLGAMNKQSSFDLLDAYFDMGGNFIDTANAYQDGSSEAFIGEWMEKRIFRSDVTQKIHFAGNGAKSLHLSVDASLVKLRTSYIDLLYIHWWHFETSIKEVMDNLHALILQRKVLYIGASDTPAWVVSQANQYALDHGKTPFCIYQGNWNVMERSFEREIIPMARSLNIALAPWNVLAAGKLRTDAEEQRRRETGERGRTIYDPKWERTEAQVKMSRALEVVAKEVGADSIPAVAIAYVMQKTSFVFPIIGGRKIEHLKANVQALEIVLSKKHIDYLESIIPFDAGFPASIIGNGSETSIWLKAAALHTRQPLLEPIRP
ncbi:Aldo/keto reductase [Hymenopellis radicata]|nr:Aldo/keto reductase [Hymenopellis radicata]